MDPATKARFAEGSSAERVNSNLKDSTGIAMFGYGKLLLLIFIMRKTLNNPICV
jgi:hypothetical protein